MPDTHRRSTVSEVGEWFAQRAATVDDGTADPREGLRQLAAGGLLGSSNLQEGFELIRLVAQADLASAFSLWAHTMVLECLAAAQAPQLQAQVARLRQGQAWGSTAMAPAIKHLAGLGDLPITYRRDGTELVLDGAIPWASNLFDDDVVLVLSARSTEGPPLVIAVDGRNPRVRFGRPLSLLALGATASSTVELSGARVEADAVISEDFTGYMKAMKPRLLLLQTAYCLGLAEAGLTAGAQLLDRAPAVYRRDHADLAQEVDEVVKRAAVLVAALQPAREIGALRLRAAQAAQAAVGLELRLSGGRGFLAGSPTARRYREAAFLPVQTPTEGQLLTELG